MPNAARNTFSDILPGQLPGSSLGGPVTNALVYGGLNIAIVTGKNISGKIISVRHAPVLATWSYLSACKAPSWQGAWNFRIAQLDWGCGSFVAEGMALPLR